MITIELQTHALVFYFIYIDLVIPMKFKTIGLISCFGRNIEFVIPVDDRCCEFVLVFVSNKTMIHQLANVGVAHDCVANVGVAVRAPTSGEEVSSRYTGEELPQHTALGGGHALRQADDSE